MNTKPLSYDEARKRKLTAATTVRIFGVPLQTKASDGYIRIWWCGIGVDVAEHRQATSRIWHLPEGEIVGSGKAEDFTFEGRHVHWYDLHQDCTPVEESYSPVSLAHSARLFLGGRRLPGDFFGGGFDVVPVTLDPTAGPTGTKPPTTLLP